MANITIDESGAKALLGIVQQIEGISKRTVGNLSTASKEQSDIASKYANLAQRNLDNIIRAKQGVESAFNESQRKIRNIQDDLTAFTRARMQLEKEGQKDSEEYIRLGERIKLSQRELYGETVKLQRAHEAKTSLIKREKTLSDQIKNNTEVEARKQKELSRIEAESEAHMISKAEAARQIQQALAEAEQSTISMSKAERFLGTLNSYNRGSVSSIATGFVNDIGSSIASKLDTPIGQIVKATLSVGASISNSLNSLNSAMVEPVVGIYKSMGKAEAKLYGSGKSFQNMISNINEVVGTTGLVTQQEVANQMTQLVSNGILYNVEQRSLFASLEENLVATFETTNAELQRLIRLQQEDTTSAYMGSESLLNAFLARNFNDTSYLNTQYDSVYGSIIDSIAGLNSDQALQFNYNLQKWLGSLYSVGLSQGAISGIASAINSLATGDLDSNSQTLMALTTQRTGKSYASYLTSGLQGDDVNTLMKSMVEYLQSIASNTDSNVIRKQFGNMFGLTMADWTALANLSAADIGTIANDAVNLSIATKETEKLISSTLSERIHSSVRIQNVFDNAKFSYGTAIANEDKLYAAYLGSNWMMSLANKFDDAVKQAVQVSEIVTQGRLAMAGMGNVISAFTGTPIDTNGGRPNLLSLLGMLGNSVFDSFSNGTISLGAVLGNMVENYSQLAQLGSFNNSIKMRGGLENAVVSNGVTTGTSASLMVTLTQDSQQDLADDIVESSMQEQRSLSMEEEANKKSSSYINIQNQELENLTSRSIEDLYAALFENENDPLRVQIFRYSDEAIRQMENAFRSNDIVAELGMMRNS